MATEVLRISVTDDGSARVVARNLENIGKAGDRATKSTDILRRALIGLGAAAVTRQIVAMSDEFTRMQNTLQPTFRNLGRTNSALRELAEVASRSNSGLGIAVETYDSPGDSLERLGVSHERLLPVTETLLKQFQLGGQSASEASSSLKQLAASLASNDFSRGLQTLLRQNLDFTNALAKAYGTNAEELRNWAKDGRLSTESFLAAVERMRAETDRDFGLLGSTIGQAVGEVSDSITLLVGNFFNQSDAGRAATSTMKELAGAIRDLAGDAERMDRIVKPVVGTLRELAELAQQTAFRFGGDPDVLGLGGVPRAEIEKRLSSLREMKRILETPASELGLFDRVRRALIPDDETFSPERILADIAKLEAELGRRFLANAKPPAGFVPPAPAPTPTPSPTDTGTDPRSLLAPGRTAARELEEAARASERAREAFARLRGEYDPLAAAGEKYAEALATVNEALRLGLTDQATAVEVLKGATAELDKARNAAKLAALEGFERLRAELDPAAAAGQQYAATVREINAALAANPALQGQAVELLQLATDRYMKAREELAGKGKGGDVFGAIAGQFDSALNSLVNFANTGKASISDFARSAVADLQRVFLQMLLVRSFEGLSGAFGGASGGGLGGIFGALAKSFGGGMADGGPVSPGKVFLVGERGPELFVPPTRGNILANDEIMGGGRGAVVNQTIEIDPMRFVDVMQTKEAEGVVLNIIQRNRGKLREIVG